MSGRGMGIAAIVLVILVGVVLSLGGGVSSTSGSVGSSDRDGRLAAFLLLDELGFEPEPWSAPPGELPSGPHQLWLADAPFSFEAADEASSEEPVAEDPLEIARARGASGLARYREFMEQGGTLVLPATESVLAFLVEGLGLAADAIPELESDDAPARFGRDLTDARGLAKTLPVGAGGCRLIPPGDYLDNDELDEEGHALFLVRTVELGDPDGRLLFDEYALGLGAGESSASLAVSPRGLLLTLNLALVLLVVTWRSAWAREFPRDPEPLGRVSPLARARGLAAVMIRAERFDALADMLRAGDGRRGAPEPPERLRHTPTTLDELAELDRELREAEHVARGGGTQ